MAKKRIKINDNLLNTWRIKYYATTLKEVAESTKLSKPTISGAITTGFTSQESFDKLKVFFAKLSQSGVK